MKKYKIGYTTGVYDLFHVGHLNILKNAKMLCKYLVVGVSTDELVQQYKNKTPVIPYEHRAKIVEAIRYVDKVVPQVDMNKVTAHNSYKFDVIFVGSDWEGSKAWNDFEKEFKNLNVDVVYLPHTDGISSTLLKSKL